MMVAAVLYRFINDSYIFFEKTPKLFGDSEKSCTFAPNMTSHASHTNSAPGEVFEFL